MDYEVSFGRWLQKRRKALDLTQEELAQCVGCSVSTIRKIEADARRPSRQVAGLLAGCLDISPEERETFLKVARARLRTDRLGEASSARPTGFASPIVSLPAPLTPLVGRQHELAEINRVLANPECRLLTLTGLAGIGKTRLAIEAASTLGQAFTDGVYLVSLAPVTAVEYIVPTIAGVLGFAFQDPTDPKDQLLNYLREKTLLLVLDNMEHLLEGTGLVAELLHSAPRVKLLVTSPERLNLPGEWVFEVQGLPVPPGDQTEGLEAYSAVALFLQRARHVAPGFALESCNQAEVVRICQLLDGLPLGIELAAAWVRVLPCDEIAQEIERNLDFLTTSAHGVLPRHRSLRAAFDHSWNLLSAGHKQVLRQLSVFRGGFLRKAAGQVAGASLQSLSALVDKTLASRASDGRYYLHELIRQYANSWLQDNLQEADATRDRHSLYYLTFLKEQETVLQSHRQKEALAAISAEIDNIRVAWQWAVTRCFCVDLGDAATSLMLYLELRNLFQEGESLFNKALQMIQAQPAPDGPERAGHEIALGDLLAKRAWFTYRLGRTEEALALLRQSIGLLREQENRNALADALWFYASACWFAGDFEEAASSSQESLALNRIRGSQWHIANMSLYTGIMALEQGADDEAYSLLKDGLALSRATGDPRLIALGASFLSRTPQAIRQASQTTHMLKEALQLTEETGDRVGKGLVLERLAHLAQATGDIQEAHRLFTRLLTSYQEINDAWSMSRTLNNAGQLALMEGDVEKARHRFVEALGTASGAQALANILDALVGLAAVSAQAGAYREALEVLYPALSHPAARQETRHQAEQLWAESTRYLSSPDIAAIQNRASGIAPDALLEQTVRAYVA